MMTRERQRLYPYQAKGVDSLRVGSWRERKMRKTIVTLPTGGGKTSISGYTLAAALDAGWSGIFFAHRTELIEQAHQRLLQFGIEGAYVKAGKPERYDLPLLIASVQTASQPARLRRIVEWARGRRIVLFIDECHRTAGATYLTILAAIESVAKVVVVVGLTATPYRLDGKGLGCPENISAGIYHDLVEVTTPAYLFDNGLCRACWTENKVGHVCCGGHIIRPFLMRPQIYECANVDMTGVKRVRGDLDGAEVSRRMRKVELVADIPTTYERLAPGETGAFFAVDRAHAQMVADSFNERAKSFRRPVYDGGKYCAFLDGETDPGERACILAMLSIGRYKIVSQCGVLIEGWDPESDYKRVTDDSTYWPTRDTPPEYVPVTVTIDGCPTQSLGRWMQGPIGRNTRSHLKKPWAKVLDHASNLRRLKCWPDDHHTFDLGGLKIRDKGAPEKQSTEIVKCPDCLGTFKPGPANCPYCGTPILIKSAGRDVVVVDGELTLATRPEESKRPATPAEREAMYLKLLAECKARSEPPTVADSNFRALFKMTVPLDVKSRCYRQSGFAAYLR